MFILRNKNYNKATKVGFLLFYRKSYMFRAKESKYSALADIAYISYTKYYLEEYWLIENTYNVWEFSFLYREFTKHAQIAAYF